MKRTTHRLTTLRAALAAVLAMALPSTALSASVSPRSTVASCTIPAFNKAAGKSGPGGFIRVQCAQGWGLAAGPNGARGYLDLFRQQRGRWVEVNALVPDEIYGADPLEFAGVKVSPQLLEELARPFELSVRRLVDAGALVEELAGHEARLGAPDAYQSSTVVRAHGQSWLVLSGADSAYKLNTRVDASPFPDGTVRIYRWTSGTWTEQGAVHGWLGPIGGCCGIAAVSLTGSHDPDFALTGGGAADTLWLAIVSDAGGHWHAVPFDYGYSGTTVVNGQPTAHGVTTWVDASSSAGGPTTGLFETYQGGAFRPASPPGPSPACNLMALQIAADPGQLAVLQLTKFACADGWAMAIGTGAGYTGQVVGLFEANKPNWRTVELDNGDSLGSDPGIYDIPLSLLRRLAVDFGPGVKPALATAPLVAVQAMIGSPYLNGVITAANAQWYVAEKPTGNSDAPGAVATIYRWSGTAWKEQGQVDRVPTSLNYYYQTRAGGWFQAVTVPGAADPAFIMPGYSSSASAVLTDVGGTWHVAPYSPSRR